jgi:hypothetical protein
MKRNLLTSITALALVHGAYAQPPGDLLSAARNQRLTGFDNKYVYSTGVTDAQAYFLSHRKQTPAGDGSWTTAGTKDQWLADAKILADAHCGQNAVEISGYIEDS